MRIQIILAIFERRIKETPHEFLSLILYIIFPVFTLLFNNLIISNSFPKTFYVGIFSIAYIGITPVISIALTITEEKAHSTLTSLLMASVKPMEYLIGIGLYVLILSAICLLIFSIIGELTGIIQILFFLYLLIGTVISIALGAVIGLIANSETTAMSLSLPICLILSSLPIISLMNEDIAKYTFVLYTCQIYQILFGDNTSFMASIVVITANIIIVLFIFRILFRKTNLYNNSEL